MFATLFVVSLFVLACVVGLLGEFGNVIKNFFVGVFGLASIPVFVALAVISVMYIFGRRITCRLWQAIKYFGTVLFIILTFHAITSNGYVEGNSFFEYLLACYTNTTAGGLVFAIPAYPLMSVSYALALVVFIVLALGLATLSILPEISKENGKSRKITARGKRPTPVDFNSYPHQGGVGERGVGSDLFVSSVNGDKSDDKIQRQRGNVNTNVDLLYPNRLDGDEFVSSPVTNQVDKALSDEEKKRAAYDSLFNYQSSYESNDYVNGISGLSKATVFPGTEQDVKESDSILKSPPPIVFNDVDLRSYTNNGRREDLNNGTSSKASLANYVSKYDELFGEKKGELEASSNADMHASDTSNIVKYDEPYSQASDRVDFEDEVDENYGVNTGFTSVFDAPVAPKPVVDEPVSEPKKPMGIFDLNFGTVESNEPDDNFDLSDDDNAEPIIDDDDDSYVEPITISKPVEPEPVVKVDPDRLLRFKMPENFTKPVESKPVEVAQPTPEPVAKPEPKRVARPYVAPPVDLLSNIVPINAAENEREIASNSDQIVSTLNDFGISSVVSGVTVGSAFTRYEIQIDRKVSVSAVLKYQSDIAMKLRATSIRIEAPIPGMDAIGIEIPNKNRSTIGVKRVMERGEFFKHKSPIAFCLGENITGEGVICDIAEMPHLLIAGTTGSGKSVCLNSLIVSIICKSSPEDVKMLLIDPKRVELGIFSGLPHLLVKEAICDVDKVLNALNWTIDEMYKRLELFRAVDARNIVEYNEIVLADKSAPKLPYIVVVVDEFGELMLAAKRDIEGKIQRLAQLARAAGIHLILATQRPSVDVITGTIKANLTSRIAFSVSSAVDSKTILDYGGAEKLLGKGDMLYVRNGKSVRLQGPFITGKEVKDIVQYVKSHNDSYYDPAIEKIIFAVKEEFDSANVGTGEPQNRENELDDVFIPALKHIITTNVASISSLTTMFSIGYNRAARIIFQMEKRGFIGKAEGGNKSRKVIITASEFEELFGESVDSDDGF